MDPPSAIAEVTETEGSFQTLDGNEAVARIAYALNEIIAVFPITPASPMGEWADVWADAKSTNLWGGVPAVIEMQSEAGAAGALHGALQTGSLATTFTASQGLLLMLPNMFKIAGELTPAVFHIAARSLAAQALSIFGDHGDVMAVRSSGWGMLCAGNVQEAQDFALIAQVVTLRARVPFLHFFDGFRTSHEIAKIRLISEQTMRAMVDEEDIWRHRERALSPEHPTLRGTSQNPDVYFQARETVNPFYAACPDVVQEVMHRFASLTGRHYELFEYQGAPDAERVVVAMGSGAETLCETANWLVSQGEKVGVLKVRLFRPFDVMRFSAGLPRTVQSLAVLDRCKEAGCPGEPLYLDVVAALHEANRSEIFVSGGRYGLASKEFTPGMARAVFAHLASVNPKRHFTIGIHDDLSRTSLEWDPSFSIESDDSFRAVFYGLGSDGTVSANKEAIKIIGEKTDHYAQGYFVYDSKKAGAVTVSHLRFGPDPIRAPYLIEHAHFIGCHHPLFLERFDVAEKLLPGGVLLLNSPSPPEKVWGTLPPETQKTLLDQRARLFVIDASKVAAACGMTGRINTVMQVCFFSISGVLPHDEALEAIRNSIRKTYAKKGDEIVSMNLEAMENTLQNLQEVPLREEIGSRIALRPPISEKAPAFVDHVLGEIIAGRGDQLPVSSLPCDGVYPTGTARWEKRNLAAEIPVWDPDVCIQCGKCVMICPHAVIRSKVYEPAALASAPETFKSRDARLPAWKGLKYTLQVAPEDCTGCGICVDVCPARSKSEARHKAINMQRQPPLRDIERTNWDFFLSLPAQHANSTGSVREMQTMEPLFEFSGACAGCGETPYLKLLSQLFGDRLLVANATGCSSIYGGNLPTTPWTFNAEGRGPAWSNSLFEDNAEFGYGFRVSLDQQRNFAAALLEQLAPQLGDCMVKGLLAGKKNEAADIYEQRQRVAELRNALVSIGSPDARGLLPLLDSLIPKSVWIVGGDGWAYDIGYGGLDHVLASGRNIKVLVLDTEVYSNTGGQCSKATPRGAVAKFAAGGKPGPKKDLGLMAMSYGHVYVASVAMGAKDEHTLKVFLEAERYDGPALIIAYSHCIAHGITMTLGARSQQAAVHSGQWLLYRFDPLRAARHENPLILDSVPPRGDLADYFALENRFRMLGKTHPDEAQRALESARRDAGRRRELFEFLASRKNSHSEKS